MLPLDWLGEDFALPGYDGWELMGKQIGNGGQGTVYRARSPERVAQLRPIAAAIEKMIKQWVGPQPDFQEFARMVVEVGGPDPPEYIGALKEFTIPNDNVEDANQAIKRLESEVAALTQVRHRSVLRLLHQNISGRFIVTEYHDNGTLDTNLNRHKGTALAALQAFRQLVDGVCEIHSHNAIHRDIKPENIFLSSSADLVLGDFGIVFFQEGGRLTTTFERVGTHYWMAPWAYDNVRLEINRINPTLDVYPLGKVLLSMIAGRNGFPFWEFDRAENNLEMLFPTDPFMSLINNELLSQCIVREEKDCKLRTSVDLRSKVDALIAEITTRRGYRSDDALSWSCQVCGKGKYRDKLGSNYIMKAYRGGGPASEQNVYLHVLYTLGYKLQKKNPPSLSTFMSRTHQQPIQCDESLTAGRCSGRKERSRGRLPQSRQVTNTGASGMSQWGKRRR